MMLMYDTTPMPESKLPPIYIRKEHKRLKMDPSGKRILDIKANTKFIYMHVCSNEYIYLWSKKCFWIETR